MKVLKVLLAVLLLLVVVFIILGVVAPKDFKVERSTVINAPAEIIMKEVSSLQSMQENWSPWSELDPDMTVTYDGVDGEVGSSSSWEGNDKVGKGKQEVLLITEDRVETELIFIEPWQDTSIAYIQLADAEEGQNVTWGMTGNAPFPANVFFMLMGGTDAIEKDYDKGLAMLKEHCELLAEQGPDNEFGGYTIDNVEWSERDYYGIRDTVEAAELGNYFAINLPKVFSAIKTGGLEMAGRPSGIYFDWNETRLIMELAAAIPVTDNATELEDLEPITVPDGNAYHITYYGDYNQLNRAHEAMESYMAVNGIGGWDQLIEEYVTDPTTEPDTSKWMTNLYYFVESVDNP